jgi:hypothetical protein
MAATKNREIPKDIVEFNKKYGIVIDEEKFWESMDRLCPEYGKDPEPKICFSTLLADSCINQDVCDQASRYVNKYIDKFEMGQFTNMYTPADGHVFSIANRWFQLPFNESAPEISMMTIHRYFNVLGRVILTNTGSDEDEKETIRNAKKLYEQGNANVYKVVAFGIIHGFITGTMDLDLIMEFIPDFYNEANGIDHKKIKTWNEAVDMQTDIPEDVRNMFIAEKNGYVEAGHFDDPAEYQAPKDDAPVVTPSANNSEEDISLDANAAKPMEAVVPKQNPKGAAMIANNNNGAPEIVRPNEQPIAAAIRRVASAISQPPQSSGNVTPVTDLHVIPQQNPKGSAAPVASNNNGALDVVHQNEQPITAAIRRVSSANSQPPQSAGNVTPVTDLHVIDPPEGQVQMVQAITLPGTDPNEQNITFDDVLSGNGVAKAVPVTHAPEANQSAPAAPTAPAQPVSNKPPQIAAVDAGNNELFARTYPGIERLTNLINSFGLVVSYGSSDYPGVIAAGIYNPALLDQHGNWILLKIIGVDYKTIYGDDIRVMPLIKGHDIRCEPSICLHDQAMVTKFILGTITQEDNRMIIDQIPPEIVSIHNEFMFVDRMDMSNLPEITHEDWVKLVKNIYKVLGNKSLDNIRFRISSYTNPDKFIMVADNRVNYPFPSKIANYLQNKNAASDELTVSVDNSKPHKDGEVRYSIRTNKKNK